MATQIPPPQDAPVVDQGGRFSTIWYRWFYAVFQQLGSGIIGVLGTAATKAASDNTKPVLSSVVPPIIAGDIAVFADIAGSIKDGGTLGTLALQNANAVMIT